MIVTFSKSGKEFVLMGKPFGTTHVFAIDNGDIGVAKSCPIRKPALLQARAGRLPAEHMFFIPLEL